MKPLELRVFDNIDRNAQGWEIASDSTPVHTWRTIPIGMADALTKGKHLTPAECAAEYWASSWREVYPACSEDVQRESARRAHILYRFATLPHAAEKDYE